MILSIVIPVFKVEKYIDKCLYSIYCQDVKEDFYEVIVVDDGSPDDSMKIVTKYKKHQNLRVIKQENRGLSIARNIGLKHSKGEYVWFVDSDDWLTDDSINYVLENIEKNKFIEVFASILIINYEKTDRKKIEYIHNPNVKTGQDYLFKNNNANCGACQRYIFKKSFLVNNNLYFMPHVYHEDGEFSLRMLYLVNKLQILDKPIYNYLIRVSGSITSTRNIKASYDLVRIYKRLLLFADTIVYNKPNYWQYRMKIFACLYDSILFARKEIFTKEFKIFYNIHKNYIKQQSSQLLYHYKEIGIRNYVTCIRFALFPLVYTKFKHIINIYFLKR